jgi:hypothetical protein
VRIADIVFRQGHLSEDQLTEAVLTGSRPAHLETCDECSRRARELGLWLGDVRAEALAAADEVFPPERLALQHSQIMRRLEQLDAPPRVIAFPASTEAVARPGNGRRVAPAWVGVAAAAGLVIGIIGGQFSARVAPAADGSLAPTQTQQTEPATEAPSALDAGPMNASLLTDWEMQVPDTLMLIDQATPTLLEVQYASAR